MTHVLSAADAETYLFLGVTPREIVLLRYPEVFRTQRGVWINSELEPIRTLRGVHTWADCLAEADWRSR